VFVGCKAYNDWHIDEWCGAYPAEVHPDLAIPVNRDAEGRGRAEVRGSRKEKGCARAEPHRRTPAGWAIPLHNEYGKPALEGVVGPTKKHGDGISQFRVLGTGWPDPPRPMGRPMEVVMINAAAMNIVQGAGPRTWMWFAAHQGGTRT